MWGPGYETAGGNLRVYMAQLRRKLEPNPAARGTCSPSPAWVTASSRTPTADAGRGRRDCANQQPTAAEYGEVTSAVLTSVRYVDSPELPGNKQHANHHPPGSGSFPRAKERCLMSLGHARLLTSNGGGVPSMTGLAASYAWAIRRTSWSP